jgi:hypothetical protein
VDPEIANAMTYMPEAEALENHSLPSEQKSQQASSK